MEVHKAADTAALRRKLAALLAGRLPDVTAAGRAVAEARALPVIGRELCRLYAGLPAPRRAAPRLSPRRAL